MSSLDRQAAADKLGERITSLLGDSLGGVPFVGLLMSYLKTQSPIFVAVCAGVVYAVLFCGAPWLIHEPDRNLLWLSAWGSGYFAFSAAIAISTSSSVLRIIKNNILPELSERAASAMDEDLARRFGAMRVSVVSYGAALVATVVSVVAILHDLYPNRNLFSAPWVEVAFPSLGLFILYLIAARATDVARFYGTFATHLKIDADRLYALDPARSVLVTQIAAVGRGLLLFWFGISCSVLTLCIFLFFTDLRWFVLFVVPTATFFSIGVSTIVFLSSEHNIRHVVNEVSASTLRSTERELAALFNRRGELDQLGWNHLKELMSFHKQLADTGGTETPSSAC